VVRRAAMSDAATVTNGRFLAQTLSGVQRYAFSVLYALDQSAASSETTILVPRIAKDPEFLRMAVVRAGHGTGYGWEQFELPYYASGRRLLNLCNTAPAIMRDQIVCIHDANIFAAPGSYSVTFRAVYQNLQPILARRSARIATVSHAAARQIARHLPVLLKDIAVLPNGHEHALRWNPALATAAPALIASRSGQRPFVLALGSRARHKNLALLINVAARLDELGIDIVIAGGGDDIFAPQALEDRPNVYLAGRVSDDDLAFFLDNALCLAFPSLTEGFGLPIIEAMARGCPVVSSNCASMPEVCGDAALLATPFEPEAWLHHIHQIAQSKDLRDDLVGRGLRQVKRFSWRQTASGYLELLKSPGADLAIFAPARGQMPQVAVIIATRGRPEIASATVRHFVATQSLKPAAVIVSCVELADAGDLGSLCGVTIVTGPPGLAAQRNTGLASLPPGIEIVAFFDDDFVADANWLASAAQVFCDEGQVVAVTGEVVADGIKGPGIAFDEAARLVAEARTPKPRWTEPYSPYGCNMAFRVSAIREMRFDERLVLYGWLEDRDFAATLAKGGGRLIKWSLAYGAHMGAKNARVSGVRLGYSQVVNPLYMMGKGTMTLVNVADHILRNTASNFARAVWPEPFIDRKGRAKGNLLAIADILRGRLEPERAAAISPGKAIRLRGQRHEAQ